MTEKTLPLSRLKTQADTCMTILSGALNAVIEESRPADQFLSGYFRNDRRLGSRDRRLIGQIVFSVFRQFGFLSAAFPERVPVRASKCTLSLFMLGAALIEGFRHEICSVLLRNIPVSESDFLPLYDIKDELERFRRFVSLAGSAYVPDFHHALPAWALDELAVPFDEAFYRILQTRPPMWIRAQTDDLSALSASLENAGLKPRPHGQVSGAFANPDAHVNLYTLDAFRKGLFELQDLSSQCIGLACLPKPGEIWWDACAGGGGKSLQLASLMQGKGVVTATDIRAYKLQDLRKRAARADFQNIRTGAWDGGEPDKGRRGLYHGVLVDAPCSSSGRWRRNPDARLIAKKEWIDELSATQKQLLDHASKAVRPGGVLVYATCSMFKREDEEVVAAFLESHPDFALEPFPNPLTGVMNDGMQRIMPADADCDASFSARFRNRKRG